MKKSLKILILEDLEEDIGLVKRALSKDGMEFTMEDVDTKEDFIQGLNSFKPDVILSDHSLPQFNSIEALKIYKKKKLDIPFILVTGTVSEEFAVSCMEEGADNYVLKSNLSRLPSAIRNSIRHRLDERKRKEAELKLRTQNKELIKINSELDAFVYNISHNLRAPLLSTIGLLKLAKMELKTADTNTIQLYYDKMEESVLKLDDTLKEILDYSRNARSELKHEIVNLQNIIDDTFDKLKYLPRFDEIEKIVSINEEVSFFSDRYRLGIVFNNLISNALKYFDPEKRENWLKIDIKINANQAKFIIEDNGIGIDEVHLPKVFQMFYRATERSKGSGLGLYIVKEDIQKLGGAVELTSTLTQGTRFDITLPNHNR